MIQDAVAHHYILEQTDFVVNQNGEYAIAIPEHFNVSFVRNQWLVRPDKTQVDDNGNTWYAFANMTNLVLIVHPPVKGFVGKALPVQEAMMATMTTGTSNELYNMTSSPRRQRVQQEDQNNNLTVPEDKRYDKMYVGRNAAYVAPSPPIHNLKMPQNTRENHRLVAIYLSEAREQYDPMKIQPPLAVEMQVIDGDRWFNANHQLLIVATFGGVVEKDSWLDDDSERVTVQDATGNLRIAYRTPQLGYPYGKATGLSGATGDIRIYKSINGDYATDNSDVGWSFSVDTWILRETFNANRKKKYAFRFRACWSRDSNQNMIWRQLGVVVGFTTNLAPVAPTILYME